MILSDGAQVADGKLYVLGGGWTRMKPNTPAPHALGVIVHVPFDMTNQELKLELALLDDDGKGVQPPGAPGPVKAEGEFEVGRPPGVKSGELMNFPLALTFNGIALEPGGYVWQCTVGGQQVARWPFRVV